MEPIICEKKIRYWGIVFKVNSKDEWSVRVFGNPIGEQNMIPIPFYIPIDKEKVPKQALFEFN